MHGGGEIPDRERVIYYDLGSDCKVMVGGGEFSFSSRMELELCVGYGWRYGYHHSWWWVVVRDGDGGNGVMIRWHAGYDRFPALHHTALPPTIIFPLFHLTST